MIVLPRLLELLKFIRHDSPTAREIQAHTGISESQLRFYLRQLELHGFIRTTLSEDKQTKGRIPRVYVLEADWRGCRER